MIRKHQRTRAARTPRDGAVTVEFAIVAPLIFLLFLGAIEMTRLNFIRHTVANAAYEAARQMIVPGGTAEDAEERANSLLTMVGVGQGVHVEVSETSNQVSATVTVPVNQNSWGILYFSSGMNISKTCSLTRETVQ